ncbi:hypothetical protein H9P43_004596 [Blastocladiella emersonii ATCC 22665]|nr:hypothetical protein H9P43_004596 [Blastocladiella emersonii ATCC 22665]
MTTSSLEHEVQLGLAEFAALRFDGHPRSFPAVLDLVRRCPYPPVIHHVFDRVFAVFLHVDVHVTGDASSAKLRFALVELVAQLAGYLPRIDGADPLVFARHLIAAFEQQNSETWILAFRMIQATLPLTGTCALLYHHITLGFFQTDAIATAAVALAKVLVRETAAFPEYFLPWALGHLRELSLPRQRDVLVILGLATRPFALVQRIKAACRGWIDELERATEAGTLDAAATAVSGNADTVPSVLADPRQRARLLRYVQATLLQAVSRSPLLNAADWADVSAALTGGPTSSPLVTYQGLQVLSRVPDHQLFSPPAATLLQVLGTDASWTRHTHPRVRAAARGLLARLLRSPRAGVPPASLAWDVVAAEPMSLETCTVLGTALAVGRPEIDPGAVFGWSLNQLAMHMSAASAVAAGDAARVAALVRTMCAAVHRVPALALPAYAFFYDHVRPDKQVRGHARVALARGLASVCPLLPAPDTPGAPAQVDLANAVAALREQPAADPASLPVQRVILRGLAPHAAVAVPLHVLAPAPWAAYTLACDLLVHPAAAAPWKAGAHATLAHLARLIPHERLAAWVAHLASLAHTQAAALAGEELAGGSKAVVDATNSTALLADALPLPSFHRFVAHADAELARHLRVAACAKADPRAASRMAAALAELAAQYRHLGAAYQDADDKSRRVLGDRATAVDRMRKWITVKGELGDGDVLAETRKVLGVAPPRYLVRRREWDLDVIAVPSATASNPVVVATRLDLDSDAPDLLDAVVFQLYGQIAQEAQTRRPLPPFSRGQVIVVATTTPALDTSLGRDVAKRQRLADLASTDSAVVRDALRALRGVWSTVLPVDVHQHAFSRAVGVPRAALAAAAAGRKAVAVSTWSISFNRWDRLRVIGARPEMAAVVRSAIDAYWRRGVAKVSDYCGAVEFKLNGNPWISSDTNDAMLSRLMVAMILAKLRNHGYSVYTSVDISRATSDDHGETDSWIIVKGLDGM